MEIAPPLAASSAQTRRLLDWYLFARLAVVTFFLGGAIIYHLKGSVAPVQQELVPWLGAMIGLAAVQTALSAAVMKRMRDLARLIQAEFAWDLLFVLAIIYLTGGVESLYSFLYILVIVASSVFLSRRQVLIVAAAAAILYGSLLDLQYFGYLPLFGGRSLPAAIEEKDVFYAVVINVGAFLLTALLSGYLADRMRRSEQAREQKEIDYGELERLNQAILANINSGLMLIGHDGKIRSFNQAAYRITGYRLEEVYNRPVEMFFPPFAQIDPAANYSLKRGETRVKGRQGGQLILGYSASHIEDPQARDLGLLVAFQDLTEVKALEEQLKRADRLAAVGRLASGMAHEIRNPLASISGSVQLLREDPAISEENRRLMGIVIKEVNRLNLLLGDFLSFARPAPLQIDSVDLAAMLDELVDLLRAGGQAAQVTIVQHYPEQVMLAVDRQKLRQALWDLLLNAVEAAIPDGTVRLAVDLVNGEISVEDSGPGIDEKLRERIFEPFFTTKEKGTGLGLANVYANIQAHGGRVYVEASPLGGARFMIDLPDNAFLADAAEHDHGA
jgi:two-component system sensor histidine kinase PilS (NtrC family)